MRNQLTLSNKMQQILVSLSMTSFLILLCGGSLIVSAQQNVRGMRVKVSGSVCSNTATVDTNTPDKVPNLAALKGGQARWALVVGVDHYSDHDIQNLGGAWYDATALGETLLKYGGFDTRLLSNASRTEILSTLYDMAREAKGGAPELFLFSISGHGFVYNGESYVVPSDARLSGDLRSLLLTSVRTSEIKEQLKRIGAKQVLILLDVCLIEIEDGSIRQKGQMEIDWRRLNTANVTTFYATQIGYPSYENESKDVGYFTWAVVEGLRGGAANPKGEVSIKDLYSYVSRVVPQQVCRTMNGFQKPFAKIEGANLDNLLLSAVSP